MAKKIDALIQSLNQLDLVKNPKDKAAVAELKQAIALLQKYRHVISDNDDAEISNLIIRMIEKYPDILSDPNNHALQFFCQKIIAKPRMEPDVSNKFHRV